MPARKQLNRTDVLAAAARVLEERGLADFTLRRVGQELGVAGQAISWHAGSRDQLLIDVVDDVLAAVPIPIPDLDLDGVAPDDWLRLFATGFRSTVLARPLLAPVVLDLMPLSPRCLELCAAILTTLEATDHDDATVLHLYNAYVGYLIGFTAMEVTHDTISLRQQPDAAVTQRIDAAIQNHPGRLVRMFFFDGGPTSALRPGEDATSASFVRGLDALLTGFNPASALQRPTYGAAGAAAPRP